ncbi:hypothetical protein EV421DRAFT_375857 [Armillaria borealis]|uniref:Uncharacterized protein n=1 Tax=Armillaria borealis TaxID=47425 RepID=A0AA39JQR9_9AGAR|nr:hypothetical protein EV421DRAFT_375857 [Armillaria borealis]
MLNLKRAGSNPAGPAPTTKKSRPLYETPFPNPSSDNLAYKLPSSAPRAGDTGKFSPVPAPSVRRTSSRNLKENRVKSKSKSRSRSKSRKGVLESPFPIFARDAEVPSRFPKRTLSDKFQPNIPIPQQSQSTTTSPQPQFERRRRPSVPTPPRTHISFLDADVKHHGMGNIEFSIASPEVDFNRPPSQLSLYDGAGMFADVQFVSTPFRFARYGEGTIDPRLLSKRDNPLSDTDTDEEGPITSPYKHLKRSLRKRQMSAGYMTPDEEETGWISDSLISPPTRGDVEMADPEPDLVEELSLDSLILGYEDRPEPVRTRSVDSSASSLAPALPIKPATRRTRSGTVLQGATNEVTVGRTRSGTVTQRTRSGTVTQKRARSGSILAPPPVIGVGRARSGSILNRAPPPAGRKGVFSGRVSGPDGDGDDEFSEDEVCFCSPDPRLLLPFLARAVNVQYSGRRIAASSTSHTPSEGAGRADEDVQAPACGRGRGRYGRGR